MVESVDNKSGRTRWTFFKVAAVTAASSCVFLGLFCCFGMNKDKYSLPSASSRLAKKRGVFLHNIYLTAEESKQGESIVPKEAWTESIYENYESFSMIRKGVAGSRLCVRVDVPAGQDIDENEVWDGLYLTLNGHAPKARGGQWDATGVTLDFAIQSSDPLPDEGEVAICRNKNITVSRFKFRTDR